MDSSNGQQWREANPATGADVEDDPTSTGAGVVIDLRRGREASTSDQDDDRDGSAGSGGEVLEGVIVDAVPATRTSTGGTAGVGRVVARREILPSWAKSRDAFTGWVSDLAGRAWRTTVFHTLRLPVYWVKASARSPRTLVRVIAWTWGTVTDVKGRQVRAALATTAGLGGVEGTAFHRVTGQHRETVMARTIALAVVTGLLSAAVMVGWLVTPALVHWLAVAIVLPLLGIARRDPERPVVTSSVVAQSIPAFDQALIATALDALGISPLCRGLKVHGLTLAGPIHRDGPGWRADIDLPAGVTAGDVIEKRDKLAAGLRRPLVVVWPEADPEVHEARLNLWVGDKPLRSRKPRPWPLAKAGRADLFKPIPIGTDQRGRPVTLTLMFASMLIGSIPRMGKTFALRVILLAAALDHLVQLHTYDLKGGADLRPLGLVSHRHRIGDDDEDIAYLADDADQLVTEMTRRYKVLRALPDRICPEGKVTPELAARKDLRLHPIVIGIDECQIAFEHPKFGERIEAAITDLVKRGPAVGIIVILATQRPDAKSIPSAISSNAVIRLCLKVMGHQANDMVLGSGANKAGIKATMFARSEKGTGYLVGEGDDPQIITTSYVDTPTASTIAARARALREAEGTLTGYAADLDADQADTDDPAPTLLDDLAEVMKAGQAREWSETLLARLVELRPDTYGTWTTADLGGAASAYGITTVQILRREGGKAINRRGIDRTDVHAAITQREDRKAS